METNLYADELRRGGLTLHDIQKMLHGITCACAPDDLSFLGPVVARWSAKDFNKNDRVWCANYCVKGTVKRQGKEVGTVVVLRDGFKRGIAVHYEYLRKIA